MATITNLKALAEQRAALFAEMEAISETAKAETRAYTEEELSRVDELEKEIRATVNQDKLNPMAMAVIYGVAENYL